MLSEFGKLMLAVSIGLTTPVVGADLKSQLESLADAHGIVLSGEAILAGASAVAAKGDIAERIKQMLSGFNHVVVHSPQGAVSRVMVLGAVRPASALPDQIVINTKRLGSHHVLTATLIGADGAEIERQLIVDTGSTFVVLPISLADSLHIDSANLSFRELQTVAGRVKAQIGNLHALRIGGRELRNVAAAFIADADIGDNLLLGMSVLDRFQVTFQDREDRLILTFRN